MIVVIQSLLGPFIPKPLALRLVVEIQVIKVSVSIMIASTPWAYPTTPLSYIFHLGTP